jgi:hypothetical protein
MNLFKISEHLKDYSQSQLMQEMQNPSGSAPQYLIMSELQRRNRIMQQAQQGPMPQTTVADDVVNAAGVPSAGIAGMANAMAPGTDVAMNSGRASPEQTPDTRPPPPPVQRMQEGGLAGISANVSDYTPTTYSEWRTMSRSEREAAGLPTSEIGGQIRFSRFGVGMGTNDPETGERLGPTTEEISEFGGLTPAQQGGYDDSGTWVGDTTEPWERGDAGRAIFGDAWDRTFPRDDVVEEDYTPEGGDMRPQMRPDIPAEALEPERPEGSTGAGGGPAVDPMEAASDRIERQNRWLALARFGLGLASSRAPTFGQAAGEAGLSALDYMAGMQQQERENAMTQRELDIREMTAQAAMVNATRPRGGSEPAMTDPADLLKYRESLAAQLEMAPNPAVEMEIGDQIARIDLMLNQLLGVQGPAQQQLVDFDATTTTG